MKINTSVMPYQSPYTGSNTTPDISTGPAVTPTGPAVSGDGDGNGDPGIGGDWGSGGGYPGGSGGNSYEYPVRQKASAMLQPKVLMTVTRAAIGTSSSVSVSAILSFQLDPQKWDLQSPGHAVWKCEAAGFPEYTDSTSEVLIEMDPVEFDDLPYGRQTIPFRVAYYYDDLNDIIGPDTDFHFALYDYEIVEMYMNQMLQNGWT